ncbi:MAG: Hsp20/alpha crystallin family protein [Bacteroidota bacterium]|nr:Hsp20/alpha crystallin family protein [Bacteroidota bacterium]
MTIIKSNSNPLYTDSYFQRPLQSLLNSFFEETSLRASDMGFSPSSDIVENEHHYEIHVALAGVKKEDVKISFEGNVLKIEGEKKQEHKEDTSKFFKREISYGKFSRSFNIGDTDASQIEAEFKDGLLLVKIPKSKIAKTSSISIK